MSRRDSGASSVVSRRSRQSNPGGRGTGSGSGSGSGNGSSQQSRDAQFYEECRGVYLAVVKDVRDVIASRAQLALMLQQSGRNPSQKSLDKYWPPRIKKLSYEEFCAIMRQEKPTSSNDLLKAFKKMDINGDGYITHDELLRVLTQKGEKMTRKEVDLMIAEADDDGDKRLDYNEFCKMLMTTASDCRKQAIGQTEKKAINERKAKEKLQPTPRLARSTSPSPRPRKRACITKTLPAVAKTNPKVTEPRNLKTWHHAHRKGCCLFEEHGKIVSHQYVLEISTASSLWLTIKPLQLRPETAKGKPDIRVYLLRQSEDDSVGDLVAFTHMKAQQKYCLHQELKAGSYRLVPVTTGCRFRPRGKKSRTKTQLIRKEGGDGEVVLTKPFRNALADIFELVDLDGNGTLSRQEFNIFQLRTSGEAVDDDAWEVVEENFELKKGELTRKGFMDLNQMEASDLDGDSDDLWVTLHSMGFSDDLSLDEALPFILDVYTDKCKSHVKVLSLQVGGATLERALCEAAMRSGEERIVIKDAENAALYTSTEEAVVTVVVDNKSFDKFSLRLDCSKSTNCFSHRPDLDHTLVVPGRTAVVGHHLMPENEDKEWTIKCTDNIIT